MHRHQAHTPENLTISRPSHIITHTRHCCIRASISRLAPAHCVLGHISYLTTLFLLRRSGPLSLMAEHIYWKASHLIPTHTTSSMPPLAIPHSLSVQSLHREHIQTCYASQANTPSQASRSSLNTYCLFYLASSNSRNSLYLTPSSLWLEPQRRAEVPIHEFNTGPSREVARQPSPLRGHG
jgi:hypothetical protein